jgi:hypothetical protein
MRYLQSESRWRNLSQFAGDGKRCAAKIQFDRKI